MASAQPNHDPALAQSNQNTSSDPQGQNNVGGTPVGMNVTQFTGMDQNQILTLLRTLPGGALFPKVRVDHHFRLLHLLLSMPSSLNHIARVHIATRDRCPPSRALRDLMLKHTSIYSRETLKTQTLPKHSPISPSRPPSRRSQARLRAIPSETRTSPGPRRTHAARPT